MTEAIATANIIVGYIGIGYCAVILTILLFRKTDIPVYSQAQAKKTIFQKAASAILRERIKPIRFSDDRLWEIDQNDRRNQPR